MIRATIAVIGVAAAIAMLYGLQKTQPGYADITRPVAVHGALGERLTARTFELTATKITLAERIALRSGTREQTFDTSGVWAVVEAQIAARHESINVSSVSWMGASGARYAMSQRAATAPGLLPAERLEPGLPRKVLMLFELPPEQVKDATILVSRTAFSPIDSELHIKANVPTPLFVRNIARIVRGTNAGEWQLEVR